MRPQLPTTWWCVVWTSFLVLAGCQMSIPPTATPATTPNAEVVHLPSGKGQPSPVIIGYYTSWSIYARDFQVADIPAEQLTHINYAFANVDGETGTCVLGDTWADDANFRYLGELKGRFPHLKVLISVGGWTWSANFSDVASTDASRRRFVESCVTRFLIGRYEGVFDGIDIDWEFPVEGGMKPGRPEDKQNFTRLLAEFRRQLDALTQRTGTPYLLTIAGGADLDFIFRNTEMEKVAQYVDFINVMAYDYHGTWEKVTNFNAPLFFSSGDPSPGAADANVDATVQNYLRAGVPAEQLVLGVPFYGRSWAGVPDVNNGLYQPAKGVGPGTWENGVLDYWDIRQNYEPVYRKFTHPEAQVPWLYDGQTFITYDDVEAVTRKAQYVLQNGLAGIMFWELSGDVRDAPEASLLNAINTTLRRGP